jgi:hypothetical protein
MAVRTLGAGRTAGTVDARLHNRRARVARDAFPPSRPTAQPANAGSSLPLVPNCRRLSR